MSMRCVRSTTLGKSILVGREIGRDFCEAVAFENFRTPPHKRRVPARRLHSPEHAQGRTIDWGLRAFSNLVCFCMSLRDDRNWAMKIYEERADVLDADRNITYFLLKDYQEICRYMRTIGYGSKGKAEPVEKQVAAELGTGRYCSLRTTVRGKLSTQDIALFIYRDLAANLLGSGLVVVSFDTGGEFAKQFADAWFEKTDKFMKEGHSNNQNN
jgi:hypothetical protein